MSLAAFQDSVLAHFSNPPATWRTALGGDGWWTVTDAHGAPIERHRLEHQAECARSTGPAAAAWHLRTDWYLGYGGGRALTGPERRAVAEAIDQLNAPGGAERPVRFIDQHPDDDRTWSATQRADGRYTVRGAGPYPHAPGDLEFLDQHPADRLDALVVSLVGAPPAAVA